VRILALPTLLFLPDLARADHPPGTWMDPAVTVDVDADGLSSLLPLAGELLPSSVPLPDVNLSGAEEECVLGLCWNWYEWRIDVTNLAAGIVIDEMALRPGWGEISVDLTVQASVSDAASPGRIVAELEVIELIDIDQDCNLWVEPLPLSLSTRMTLGLDASGGIDVGLSPIDLDLSLDGIEMTGCTIGDIFSFVGDVNDFTSSVLSFDLFAVVADLLEPAVEGILNEQLPELEAQLDEALTGLVLEEELDLAGAPLLLTLEPSQLDVTPDGIRLAMAGAFDAGPTPHPCVSPFGIYESLGTAGGPWAIGSWPNPGQALTVQADDDFLNQALFALWWQGLLCVEVSDDGALDLPIPIDTSLLGLLAGDAYDDLFPETAPLKMVTVPRQPPTVRTDGPRDVDIDLERMGLDMYAELDGRTTRLAGLAIRGTAGVDLVLDPATGELGAEVALGPDDLSVRVGFNDLRPSTSAELETGMSGLVDTVVGPLIGGLTGDLAFPLPSLSGVGLSAIGLLPAGAGGDHLGVEARIGPVAYDNELDLEAGCDSGCEGGCSSRGSGAWWLLLVPALLARRRR
jgi:hypothetical protein